jgi:hypothetical protein
MPAESALEKALQKSLAAAAASEEADSCEAPVVEVVLGPAPDEAAPKHAAGKPKPSKPPVVVSAPTESTVNREQDLYFKNQ